MSKKLWSYSEGNYGHRVRVYERRGRKNLYIAYWDDEAQGMARTCLGHGDREKAMQECRALSDALRLGLTVGPAPASQSSGANDGTSPENTIAVAVEKPVPKFSDTENLPGEEATKDLESAKSLEAWRRIFELYHEARGRHKKGSQPAEDMRRQKIWLAFFEREEVWTPELLDNDVRDEFIRQRRRGELRVDGVDLVLADPKRPGMDVVKPGTVRADIVYLNTVLNWAVDKRISGKQLIAKNPISLPRGLSTQMPSRPVAAHEDIRDLRRVADSIDRQGLFGCFVRIHDGLGWRVTAICNIRACELHLEAIDGMPYGYILKNPHVDKRGVGQRVPLSRHLRASFVRLLRLRGLSTESEDFLFSAKKAQERPWSRWHIRDLYKRAEKAARIAPIGGTHAMRRKWVTERKDHPVPDIMRAGGWLDQRSLESYMHADDSTTYEVVSRRTRRVRRMAPR